MSHNFPKSVRIVEVGPRDGLQNEATPISTETKVELIEALADAGIKTIEAGSFVNPKWVPQMAGSDEVFQGITRQNDVSYAALTPNLTGAERAVKAGVSEMAIFAAASEAFSQKNLNCSIDESLKRFESVIQLAGDHNIPVRGYVSCVAGCPYQGDVAPEVVRDISAELMAMGCYEVSLGDTIGTGTPEQIRHLFETCTEKVAIEKLAAHMHDTFGMAIANIYAALSLGVSVIDSSTAGLGGCPYAKGASGNVATEDVIHLLNGLNIQHGIDLNKVIATGNQICAQLERPNGSKVAAAQACRND